MTTQHSPQIKAAKKHNSGKKNKSCVQSYKPTGVALHVMGCVNSTPAHSEAPVVAVCGLASQLESPSVSARASAALDVTRKAHDKVQALLDDYGGTIAWVDGALAVASVLPGLASVCSTLRDMLNRAAGMGDTAQDVVDMVESVLEAAEHLRQVESSARAAGGAVQDQLEQDMAALRQVIERIHEAIGLIGQQGFFKALFAAAKTAKALSRLAERLATKLDKIHKTLALASFDLAVASRFQTDTQAALEGRFKAGRHAAQQVQQQLELDGGEADVEDDRAAAAEIVLANPQAMGEVAAAAGLSEGTFRQEMGQLGYKMDQVNAALRAQRAVLAQVNHKMDVLQVQNAELQAGQDMLKQQNAELQDQLALLRAQMATSAQQSEMMQKQGEMMQKQDELKDEMLQAFQRAVLSKVVDVTDAKAVVDQTRLVEGALLWGEGKPAEAAAKIKAAALDASAAAEMARGYMFKDAADWRPCAAAFRRATELAPGMADAWYGLGLAISMSVRSHGLGDLRECEAAFQEAIAICPTHARALNSLGNLLRGRKDICGAERAFRAAIRANPSNPRAHNNLGQLLLKATPKDVDGAEAAFHAAIEASPRYSETAAKAHLHLGWLIQDYRTGTDRWEERAAAAYRDAASADVKGSASAQNSLGDLLRDHCKDLKGAERAFRAAVEANPSFALAQLSLGQLWCGAKSGVAALRDAEVAFRAAIKANPQLTAAHIALGTLLQNHCDDVDGAEAAFRAAIATCPPEKSADAHCHLGWLLQKERCDTDSAEAAYRAAIKANPEHTTAMDNLGDLLLHQRVPKDVDGAERMFKSSLALKPRGNVATKGLADIAAARGTVRAAASAEKAKKLARFKLKRDLQQAADAEVRAEACEAKAALKRAEAAIAEMEAAAAAARAEQRRADRAEAAMAEMAQQLEATARAADAAAPPAKTGRSLMCLVEEHNGGSAAAAAAAQRRRGSIAPVVGKRVYSVQQLRSARHGSPAPPAGCAPIPFDMRVITETQKSVKQKMEEARATEAANCA